ncbi:MAG TPA: tetratricopeptide repeat-containing serine protease family protein [Burkholderiaceae bacterium]|nr:tetratricopeptide repeat-containing serine protease family protein [Burkholderiaceae bacterium]
MTRSPPRLLAVLLLSLFALPAGAGIPQARDAMLRNDFIAARQQLQPLAEGGDAYAQFLLGQLYEFGRGVATNDAQAASWYRKAAAQGHAKAQGRYGLLLSKGRGVPQDEKEALDWWRRGADQGDADSQGLLGIAYYDGAGTAVDKAMSYRWLLLAATLPGESQFRYQRFRDRVEQEVSVEARAMAREFASAFIPHPLLALPSEPAAGSSGQSPGSAEGRQATRANGSGFVVAPGKVVTNHHVVQGCQRLRVGGTDVTGVLASEPAADLALLAWPGSSSEVASLRDDSVIGEAVMAAGYPLAGLLSGFSISTGIVSGLSGLGGDTRVLQTSAPIQQGNSGGPLLDSSGNVIGVIVSKLNALQVAQVTGDMPQNVNFAINGKILASFLQAQGVNVRHAKAASPLSTQDLARRAQAFTVLVECWR